jgi:hypothetical protein
VADQKLIDQFVSALPCAADSHFPFEVVTSKGEGGVILHGYVRIESCYGWDGAGGRTDLHDILGLAWAASLRASGAASSEVWIDVGWCGSPEIGSRFMFFDQPYGSALSEAEFEPHRSRLLAHTAWAAHDLLDAFRFGSSGNETPKWSDAKPPSWVPRLSEQVKNLDAGIWITRTNPDWEYYTDEANSISIAKLRKGAREILNHLFCLYEPTSIMIGDNYVISANGIRNSVPSQAVEKALAILKIVDGRSGAKWVGASSRAEDNCIITIPLESHCVFVGARSIVALNIPCGIVEFDQARKKWLRKSAEEAAIFNEGVQWRWSAKLDPARFEQLVEAVLSEEPGLHWVRPAGPAYERDQGRDLVVNWFTPPSIGQRLTEDEVLSPARTRKIIVQAKVRKKTIGKTDVRDVRDTLDRHEADGFLLVSHPGWSNDIFNYLESLTRLGYWVNLWGPRDIEDRLRQRPGIASRFTDLVEQKPD